MDTTYAVISIQVMQLNYYKILPSGPETSHWKLWHVSLNAAKHFQVVFEVRKGSGFSKGGFSIDDINLSENECPHFVMQLDEFEKIVNNNDPGYNIYSPKLYSTGGYSYGFGIVLQQTYIGIYVQLMSGINDGRLKWPCTERQITFQMLDQNPVLPLQMSKQRSLTTDLSTDDKGNIESQTLCFSTWQNLLFIYL